MPRTLEQVNATIASITDRIAEHQLIIEEYEAELSDLEAEAAEIEHSQDAIEVILLPMPAHSSWLLTPFRLVRGGSSSPPTTRARGDGAAWPALEWADSVAGGRRDWERVRERDTLDIIHVAAIVEAAYLAGRVAGGIEDLPW